MQRYDIAIVGAGPAGAAAAIMLARAGRRVILADATPAAAAATAFRVGEGLPPAASSLLRDLAVWPQFCAAQHRISHGNLSLWGGPQVQQNDFMRQLHGHGYQLDRARFDAMLRQAAVDAGAQVYHAARLHWQTQALDRSHHLQLDGAGIDSASQQIQASWLLDASGRAAAMARKLGAQKIEADQLLAFHALFTGAAAESQAADQDGRSMIEAVADGWWYSVLLPSRQRLFAFFSDADLIDKTACMSPHGFLARLAQTRFLSALREQHGYQLARAPQGVSAATGRLNHFHGAHWLAAGDAALSFDPLSSQGIANALYTGMRAASAVQASLAGDSQALDAYSAHLAQIHAVYLQHRRQYYAIEQRWSGQPFWQRRHAGAQ